jgi:hypothetical protein
VAVGLATVWAMGPPIPGSFRSFLTFLCVCHDFAPLAFLIGCVNGDGE